MFQKDIFQSLIVAFSRSPTQGSSAENCSAKASQFFSRWTSAIGRGKNLTSFDHMGARTTSSGLYDTGCDLKHEVALGATLCSKILAAVQCLPADWSDSTFCTIFLIVRMDSGGYSEALRRAEPTS